MLPLKTFFCFGFCCWICNCRLSRCSFTCCWDLLCVGEAAWTEPWVIKGSSSGTDRSDRILYWKASGRRCLFHFLFALYGWICIIIMVHFVPIITLASFGAFLCVLNYIVFMTCVYIEHYIQDFRQHINQIFILYFKSIFYLDFNIENIFRHLFKFYNWTFLYSVWVALLKD